MNICSYLSIIFEDNLLPIFFSALGGIAVELGGRWVLLGGLSITVGGWEGWVGGG